MKIGLTFLLMISVLFINEAFSQKIEPGLDLSYISIELVDDRGNRNPRARNLLKFTIEDPGTIVGVGNANPLSLEIYQLHQRKAWKGKCLVIVKSDRQ